VSGNNYDLNVMCLMMVSKGIVTCDVQLRGSFNGSREGLHRRYWWAKLRGSLKARL
jgi:hypothetical protein